MGTPRAAGSKSGGVGQTNREVGNRKRAAGLTKVYYDLLATYGIAYFSSRPDNFLLWSYYAASHAGVAVRFDTADQFLEQIPQTYVPLRVQYAKDFPRVSLYDPDRLGFIQNTLGTKAEAWQHEEEWRLIAIGRSGVTRIP